MKVIFYSLLVFIVNILINYLFHKYYKNLYYKFFLEFEKFFLNVYIQFIMILFQGSKLR